MIEMSELCPGERGQVADFKAVPKQFLHQLLAMGFTRGTPFQIVRVAPLGDPVAIRIRGVELCLRKSEIKGVMVERCL